ncbi:FG-GAP repeat protein, partial [Candidatus Fermentibacteria bacterium]|nr:FG-GAP repeat protein [Candidatus Fermentibacteria bacterium]
MKTCRFHGLLLAGALLVVAVPRSAGADNLDLIRQAIEAKGAQWSAGPNHIWDRAPEDRRALLGWDRSMETRQPGTIHERGSMDGLPPAWDWRSAEGDNYVTPIRDQAQCGSCWAFGALACMESRMAIDAFVPDPTVDLSEQYLVSCSPGSCNGYSISGTCEFLRTQGTLTEGCMGYQATDYVPCSSHCPHGALELVYVQNWGWIGPNRDAIKTRVLDGPVYVAFTVYSDFQAYNGGVYEHVWGEEEGGHAVAIVGWDDDLECWICKNSWGNWGEDGYFRIKYGQCMMEDWSIWLSVKIPEYPNLSVSPVSLVEMEGDGDGVANPGEIASLSFWVVNSPFWNAAEGVTLTLAENGSGTPITVTQGMASFAQTLLPGDSLLCSDMLTVALDEACPVGQIPLDLTVLSAEASPSPYQKIVPIVVEPSLDQAGWPVLTSGQFYAGPACFTWDNSMHIAVADRWGGLYLLGPDGVTLPGWPAQVGDAIRSAPAVGDVDGDGLPEIIVGSRNNTLAAYRLSGEPLLLHDVDAGIVGTVMLADFDDDSIPEMVAGTIDGLLWAVRGDGTAVDGWPV